MRTWRPFKTFSTLALATLTVMALRAPVFGVEPTDLQGHWKSSCIPGEVFGQTRTDEYLIDGTSAKQRTTYYGDPACARPIIQADWVLRINVPGEEIRPGVKAIDITYERAQVMAVNTVGSHILEAWGYCGLPEWPEQISRDVTDHAGGARCVAPLPISNYTIYSIIDGRLYVGFGFNNNVSRRPTELNVDNPFTRMP